MSGNGIATTRLCRAFIARTTRSRRGTDSSPNCLQGRTARWTNTSTACRPTKTAQGRHCEGEQSGFNGGLQLGFAGLYVSRLQLHPNEPLRRGRRPQQVATDDALRELVERYDEYRDGGRLLEFMRAVQYHLGSARFPNEVPANDNANIAGNAAPPPAPALPDVDAAPQQVPQRQGRERLFYLTFCIF